MLLSGLTAHIDGDDLSTGVKGRSVFGTSVQYSYMIYGMRDNKDACQERGRKIMYPGIHNYSEIGKLNKVLLHRIGEEVEGLVPNNFERLLFDDIPYLKVAQQEHDRFAELLRENGVEVIYYVDETAKALKDPAVKAEFLNKMLDESNLNSEGIREAIYDYLINMPTKDMVQKIIAGVKRTDIGHVETKSLADFISSNYPFYMDPMPNLYFTRDPGACHHWLSTL